MSKIGMVLSVIGMFILGFILIGVLSMYNSQVLAENEVIEIVQERYAGEVTEVDLREVEGSDIYFVELSLPLGTYEVQLTAEDGTILSFTQLSEETSSEAWTGEEDPLLSIEEVKVKIEEELNQESIEILESALIDPEGAPFYEVRVSHDGGIGNVEVDARSGVILLYTVEQDVEGNTAEIEPLTREEAIEIALEEVSGVVDDVDLEEQNGRLVFEIEIESEANGEDVDIIIDAYTGEVLTIIWDD